MKKVYKFEVTVTEDDNKPFWNDVKQYETPTNRWVTDKVVRLLNSGELFDVKVVEISPINPIDKDDNL